MINFFRKSSVNQDYRLVLDDGQVIKGRLGDLTQYQLISLANQFLREKRADLWREIMQYQHRKFIAPLPPRAA